MAEDYEKCDTLATFLQIQFQKQVYIRHWKTSGIAEIVGLSGFRTSRLAKRLGAYCTECVNDNSRSWGKKVKANGYVHQNGTGYDEVIQIWASKLHYPEISFQYHHYCCMSLVLFCWSHFRFLNVMLKSKQIIANTIPSIARISKMTMSSSLKVFVMLMGVPSGGTPPVFSIYIYLYILKMF